MTKRLLLIVALLCSASTAHAFSWCEQFGLFCPKPSWVPGYETVTVSDGFGHTTSTNPFYFADATTADKLRDMFMAAYVQIRPCTIVEAPGVCSAPQRFLVFQDRNGVIVYVIAGLIAGNYTNSPNGKSPNVAFNASITALEARNINTTAILPPSQAKKAARLEAKAAKRKK